VGEEGRLFGSVTALMIHEAILEQLGVDVDRRRIETHGHIKDIGPRVVDVAIYREVKAQLTVEVVAEGEPIPAEAAAVVAEADEAVVEAGDETDADGVAPEDDVVAETVNADVDEEASADIVEATDEEPAAE